MRKPEEEATQQVKLRLRADLRRRLEQEARHHRLTLNNEIRIRLEDSLEQGARRDLSDIVMDLRVSWLRFGARFLRMELADELANAVLQGGDAVRIRTLAQLIVEHRGAEQRDRGGVL
jgi:hypothetical protein